VHLVAFDRIVLEVLGEPRMIASGAPTVPLIRPLIGLPGCSPARSAQNNDPVRVRHAQEFAHQSLSIRL
jgi:hypothetical protein